MLMDYHLRGQLPFEEKNNIFHFVDLFLKPVAKHLTKYQILVIIIVINQFSNCVKFYF